MSKLKEHIKHYIAREWEVIMDAKYARLALTKPNSVLLKARDHLGHLWIDGKMPKGVKNLGFLTGMAVKPSLKSNLKSNATQRASKPKTVHFADSIEVKRASSLTSGLVVKSFTTAGATAPVDSRVVKSFTTAGATLPVNGRVVKPFTTAGATLPVNGRVVKPFTTAGATAPVNGRVFKSFTTAGATLPVNSRVVKPFTTAGATAPVNSPVVKPFTTAGATASVNGRVFKSFTTAGATAPVNSPVVKPFTTAGATAPVNGRVVKPFTTAGATASVNGRVFKSFTTAGANSRVVKPFTTAGATAPVNSRAGSGTSGLAVKSNSQLSVQPSAVKNYFTFSSEPKRLDCDAPTERSGIKDASSLCNRFVPDAVPPQRHYKNIMFDKHVNRGSYRIEPLYVTGPDGEEHLLSSLPYRRASTRRFPTSKKDDIVDMEVEGLGMSAAQVRRRELIALRKLIPPPKPGMADFSAQTTRPVVMLNDSLLVTSTLVQTEPEADVDRDYVQKKRDFRPVGMTDKSTETDQSIGCVDKTEAMGQSALKFADAVISHSLYEAMQENELEDLRLYQWVVNRLKRAEKRHIRLLEKRKIRYRNERMRLNLIVKDMEQVIFDMFLPPTPATRVEPVPIDLTEYKGCDIREAIHNHFYKYIAMNITDGERYSDLSRKLLDDLIEKMAEHRQMEYNQALIALRSEHNYFGSDKNNRDNTRSPGPVPNANLDLS